MKTLQEKPILSAHQPLAAFIATALHTIAHEERRGRRAPRLTEPNLATWDQLRGRLGHVDLVELLLEDACVTQRFAFDPARSSVPGADVAPHAWRGLGEQLIDKLIKEINEQPPADLIAACAAILDIHARLARSELPRSVRPHHRVLELPGSGGQLARHLIQQQADLSLREVFTLCAGSWQERALSGWIAVEANVEGAAPMLLLDPDLTHARKLHAQQPFDYILGVKAGVFDRAQLAALFPAPERELHIHLV